MSDERREAITLGLHNASPKHLMDVLAKDIAVELGWGHVFFDQTFADPVVPADLGRHDVLDAKTGELRLPNRGRTVLTQPGLPAPWTPEQRPQ